MSFLGRLIQINDAIGLWVEERVPLFWLLLPVVVVILILI